MLCRLLLPVLRCEGPMSKDLRTILSLEVPLIVQLGQRTMTMGEVLELAPGSILELPKMAEEPLEVLINNKMIGTGLAVKIGENFGVHLIEVGDLRSRVEALATRFSLGDGDAGGNREEELSDEELAMQLLEGQI